MDYDVDFPFYENNKDVSLVVARHEYLQVALLDLVAHIQHYSLHAMANCNPFEFAAEAVVMIDELNDEFDDGVVSHPVTLEGHNLYNKQPSPSPF